MAEQLSAVDREVLELADLELAKRECLRGRPFPLIALQWPHLLITDPDEAPFFDGEIGDPFNPCLRIDRHQRDIAASFFSDVKEIAVKGCTGAGKGAGVAIAVNLWYYLHEHCKIILSSANYQHAVKVIFGEVVAWRQQMFYPPRGAVQTEGFKSHRQKYLAIGNVHTGEGFSGHHGPHTLFVFDEATATSEEFYKLATTQASLIASMANPRVMSGWFRRSFPKRDTDKTQTIDTSRGKRRCITVSGRDCANVISGRELVPNQIPRHRFDAMMEDPDERWKRVFALGMFPEEDPEKQLILDSWFERHEQAFDPENPPPVEAFGLDVADSERGDRSILAAGGHQGLRGLHCRRDRDTMQTALWVSETVQREYGIDLRAGQHPIVVDSNGLGLGVADRLKELGCWVVYSTRIKLKNKDRYRNKRAELYGELARRLDPAGLWAEVPFAFPPGLDGLKQELCAPEKLYDSDGLRFGITPKNRKPGMTFKGETIQEMLGRSPDEADAVVQMFRAVWAAAWRQVPRVKRKLIGYPYQEQDMDKPVTDEADPADEAAYEPGPAYTGSGSEPPAADPITELRRSIEESFEDD